MLNTTFAVDAPCDRVIAALLSADYNTQAERLRRDTVVSTRFVEGPGTPGATFELRTREHPRTRLGQVDRTRTVETVTRFRWSPATLTLSWRHEGIAPGLLALSGEVRLSPRGDHTEVSSQVDVAITVPVVGALIERAVAKVFERAFPAERALLTRCVADAPLDRAA